MASVVNEGLPPNNTRHTALASSVDSTTSTSSHASTSTYISSLSNTMPSASPFPSPSSSFLPPPTPGAHEFAVRIPIGRKLSTPSVGLGVNHHMGGLGLTTVAKELVGKGMNGHKKDGSGGSGASEEAETPVLTRGQANVIKRTSNPGTSVVQSAPPVVEEAETSTGLVGTADGSPTRGKAKTAGNQAASTSNGAAPKVGLSGDPTLLSSSTPGSTDGVDGSLGSSQPPPAASVATSISTASLSSSSTPAATAGVPTPQEVAATPIVSPRKSSLRASTSASSLGPAPASSSLASPATPIVASAARLVGSSGHLEADSWSYTSPTTPTPSTLAFARLMKQQNDDSVDDGGGSSEVTPSPSMYISTKTSSIPASTPPPALPAVTIPSKRQSVLVDSKTPTTPKSPSFGPSSFTASRPPSLYFASGEISLTSSRPAPPSPALSATNISWSPSGGGISTSPNQKRLSRALSTGSQRSDGGEKGERGDVVPGLSRGGSKREKRFSQLSSSFTLSSPLASPTNAAFGAAVNGGAGTGTEYAGGGGGAVYGPPPPSAASTTSTVSSASTVTDGSGGTTPPASAHPGSSGVTMGVSKSTAATSPDSSSIAIAPTSVQHTEAHAKKPTKAPRTSYTTIRDFAFPASDTRHHGLGIDGQGTDVPKQNRIERLNKRLKAGWIRARRRLLESHRLSTSSISSNFSTYSNYSTSSASSASSSQDDGGYEEEEEDDGYGMGGSGWEGFSMRFGRMSWSAGFGASSVPSTSTGSGTNGYPSRGDLDRNFLDGPADEEVYDDVDEDFDDELLDGEAEYAEEEGEEELYPGIYRAMFAFEPEGTAETPLTEDQLVRVVGRGAGVGWAIIEVGWKPTRALVRDLRVMGADLGGLEEGDFEFAEEAEAGKVNSAVNGAESGKARHGLVPESYLTPVRLDGVLA